MPVESSCARLEEVGDPEFELTVVALWELCVRRRVYRQIQAPKPCQNFVYKYGKNV